MRIINLQQGSPAWLDFRRSGIGSSDIAAIMGLSPYKTALDVYEEKMGLKTSHINNAMKRGTEYEPFARAAFQVIVDGDYPPVVCMHDEYDYMFSSLDGYNEKTDALVEIKVPLEKNFESYKQLSQHYYIQIQWHLMISGAKYAYYFVFNPNDYDSSYIEKISPDESLFERMKLEAISFWENFQKGIPPEDDSTDSFLEIVDDELISRERMYIQMLEQVKNLEKMMDTLKNEMYEFGDDGNFMGKYLKFTKTFRDGSIDYKLMAKEMNIPLEAFEKYRKPGKWFYTTTKRKD